MSLDAHSTLATLAARSLWSVPYFRGDFAVQRNAHAWSYRFERRWPQPRPASFSAAYRVGEALPASVDGSLQFFLAERYAFYASSRGGDLLHAPVHHEPYALHRVGVESVEHRLFELCGVTSLGLPTAAFFSPGVDVEVFRQRRVR